MRLKHAIETDLGVPVRIRAGAPGSLRVLVDGSEIYSLRDASHDPDTDEILKQIRQRA